MGSSSLYESIPGNNFQVRKTDEGDSPRFIEPPIISLNWKMYLDTVCTKLKRKYIYIMSSRPIVSVLCTALCTVPRDEIFLSL